MAFTLQIISSFPTESFISADTFLQNLSVSGQGFPAGGVLSRGARPAPAAAPTNTAWCAPTRGPSGAVPCSCPPPGPAWPCTRSTSEFSVCRAMERGFGFGSAQLLSRAFVHPLHCSHKTPVSFLFPCCLASQERAAFAGRSSPQE